MSVEVRPATDFDDVRAVVGPERPDANVCWCLSYRIPAKENTALRGPERGERVRRLMESDVPLGVAYAGLRQNFEAAGFTHAGDTASRLDGFPRVIMRRVITRDLG